MKSGASVDKDLEELWRRIVFNICIKNTDDHLRNHGFLLNDLGWSLSPVYDINPVETGIGLTLNISENDNSLELDLARETAVFFRLNLNKANSIIEDIKKTVRTWRAKATKHKIPRKEQDLVAPAFEIGEK